MELVVITWLALADHIMEMPGMFTKLRALIMQGIYSMSLRHRLLLVTDKQGWIIDEVANGIRANIPEHFQALLVAGEWHRARHSLIHFINREWAWHDGAFDGAHVSNKLVGLWWHGRLDSPEPGMQAALERAKHSISRFARMQVTCSIARDTMLTLGYPEETIVVLPEGLNLKRFSRSSPDSRAQMRTELSIPSRAVVVGCFQKDGQGWGDGMEPKLVKGPDILADTLIALSKNYPIHAVIPGPARGYLKKRLADAGVSFSAPGFVSDRDLPRCYHALDFYLSPSRDEGGPAGVLESMASGVPVVSTLAGMPADMIENGVNGFVADVEHVDDLTAFAARIIDDDVLRVQIVDNALNTIQAYDWPRLTARYVSELYQPLFQEIENGWE